MGELNRGELTLTGVRTTPLGGYLAGLGLLSAVSRLLDVDAAGYWRHQSFVLRSRFATVDDLAGSLAQHFRPEPIVSPWNLGSGFAANGKSPAAERALGWARESTDPRLAELRAAVEAGDRILATAGERGWTVEAHKELILRLCRNRFPDGVVRWLDAAVALGQDGKPSFSRLLGTGGNLGRLDLSSTYLQRVKEVIEDRRSVAWLASLLDGQTRAKLPRSSLGQFQPASAGNPEDVGEIGNPWQFVLLIEGALLFATAITRRHGAEHANAALPFQVRPTTAGFSSSAPDENLMAELWAPEWSTPWALADVEQLLGEGRAEWRDRQARSGLDMARAIASLGVDRGIVAFQRHVFAERLGQSPLAVPVDRVMVTERGGVRLLRGLDPWLDQLRRVDTGGIGVRRRAIEQAVYTHACRGTAQDLAAVFMQVGRCHEAVTRSGSARAEVQPLVLVSGQRLLSELFPAVREDLDLRIALALASGHEPGTAPTMGGLRPLLSPVEGNGRRVVWTDRSVPVSLTAGWYSALCEAARRRGFPDVAGEVDDELSAVAGVQLGFTRGPALTGADTWDLVAATVDVRRCADLLAGLLTVDWSGVTLPRLPAGPSGAMADPAVDLLVPFTGDGLVDIAIPDGALRMRLLPDRAWPALLRAGHTDRVLADAARRLRINGLRHVVTPAATAIPGERLAALLLTRIDAGTRKAALSRIAVLPSPLPSATPSSPTPEILEETSA